jgi:prepilin-type N-terminal cleavage/methylation domain-containing protein
MNRRGFTLLEMLVATVIMAVVVAGALSALSTSLSNASRLTEADRLAMLGRRKMDELLLATRVPHGIAIEGQWDPVLTGGQPAGWRAVFSAFEYVPGSAPGAPALERVQLEVWMESGERRRSLTLEGFRKGVVQPQDLMGQGAAP